MPPRGRPRKGLSRMDAAVDAMAKFGFEKGLVRKHVNQLLREYGGDEFWPFIEDCSYKELLEAILREQETDVPTGGDQIEDKSGGDKELGGPSNIGSDAEQEPLGSAPLDTAEPIYPDSIHNNVSDRNGWKDSNPNQTVENQASENDRESPSIGAEIPASLPRKKRPRRCLHFFGWIDRYEEDDDDFIILQPSSMVLGPPPKAGKTRKRRSRWDVRPGDP